MKKTWSESSNSIINHVWLVYHVVTNNLYSAKNIYQNYSFTGVAQNSFPENFTLKLCGCTAAALLKIELIPETIVLFRGVIRNFLPKQ